MRGFYELVGRAVIGFLRLRYRKQLRIAAAVAVATTVAAGYLLASREAEEG